MLKSSPKKEEKQVIEKRKVVEKSDKKKERCGKGCSWNLKWFLIVIVAFIIGLVAIFFVVTMVDLPGQENQSRKEEIASELKTFIAGYLINEGQELELIGLEEVSGLYRMNFEIDGSPVSIYTTKDGLFLIFGEGLINFEEFKVRIKSDRFQAALTAERKEKIAKCLTERGFGVYIADWCPFCRDQKELFGEAAVYLPYIDCYDPEGPYKNLDKCPAIQERGVPTWKDRDGNLLPNGMLSIKRLVTLSGCDY